MRPGSAGRRGRATQDERCRIAGAAPTLVAERGVGGVTAQQIADGPDVVTGTPHRYASTTAGLLILVQDQTSAAAVDDGGRGAAVVSAAGSR